MAAKDNVSTVRHNAGHGRKTSRRHYLVVLHATYSRVGHEVPSLPLTVQWSRHNAGHGRKTSRRHYLVVLHRLMPLNL